MRRVKTWIEVGEEGMGERGGFDKDDILVGPPDRACCSITRSLS